MGHALYLGMFHQSDVHRPDCVRLAPAATRLSLLTMAISAVSRAAGVVTRLVLRGLIHLMYRFETSGLTHIPVRGPAVLVCNHVSFVDAILIGATSPRPVRFVMDHRIFRRPLLNRLFRLVGAIPIAPRHEDPIRLAQAMEQIAQALERGELVGLFPEGKLSSTGELDEFRPGVEQILAQTPVPVVPMALTGLWGSVFSRKRGPQRSKIPQRFRAQVGLRCGPSIPASRASASRLQVQVQQLLTG